MVIDIKDRVKSAALQGKIVTAYEAALLINPNDKVGISGFTPSGYAKAVPLALAERMEKEPFKIDLWTGASVGDEADGALTRANGIHRRFPYQTNGDTRKALNSGKMNYIDMHLSTMAQNVRYGFFGDLDVAIIEAAQINEDGSIVPTTSVGNSPTFVSQAKKVIVEVCQINFEWFFFHSFSQSQWYSFCITRWSKAGNTNFIIVVNHLSCFISCDNFALEGRIFNAIFDVYHRTISLKSPC